MIEQAIELAPYELEPERQSKRNGEPFFFRALWFGSEREFVGQVLSFGENYFHLWFSLADEPERGNFVCSRGLRGEIPPYVPQVEFRAEPTQQAFIERVKNELWGRLFVLDSQLRLANRDNGCCTIFLAASGWGQVNFIHQGSAEFQWSAPCAKVLAEPDSSRYLDEVVTLAQTQEHPLQFAFEWAGILPLQRLALALPLRNGNYEQWQRLIQLHAVATLRCGEGWRSHHEIGMVSRAQSTWLRAEHYWDEVGRSGLEMQKGSNNSFQRFLLWTLAYFRPTRDDALCTTHPCVRSCVAGTPWLFSGFVEQGTQHERLEALLQLRDWLADKATPKEIEALLRED